MYRLDAHQVLRVPEFETFSWLEHGFGTRLSGDWPGEQNRATLKQIHSAKVTVANRQGVLGEGDALATDHLGLFVAIRTADCIPVLLVDPEHRAVAAVHAGWRGTAGNIVRCTIDTLVSVFHSEPARLWAAIGPGIGKCCYEVSGDVASRFGPWMPEHANAADRTMLDLTEVNRRQLIEAGLRPEQVLGTGDWCTRCQPELLHSFRRDKKESGRMQSAIRILPPA